MSSMVLVIDGQDRGRFSLSVDGGTLTVGIPSQAEAVLKDLHIKRIRCELEVEDNAVVVRDPGALALFADRELVSGGLVQLGHADLRFAEFVDKAPTEELVSPEKETPEELVAPEKDASEDLVTPEPDALEMPEDAPAPAAPAANAASAAAWVPKLLRITAGLDLGKTFVVPGIGTVSIGKSHQRAEIVLHDLAVSRVHCELQPDGDRILISHIEGANGTWVNGIRIAGKKELRPGDTVRVGDTSLKLEIIGPEVPEVEIEELEDVASEPGPAYSKAEELLGLSGRELGHYRVGAVLGHGHSGVVYLGEDLKTKQAVALKVLASDFPASGAELQHFVQALKAANSLHHANLVGLHGAGKNGGYCWLARDYVEGKSVPQLIQQCKDEGQFKWKRAGRLAVQLARALVFLHGHKIIHGNITPANVLFSEADKVFRLADARLADALAGSKLLGLISEPKQAAELPFRAPEQLDAAGRVDQRTDLYGLGAVLYALLTGEPPRRGETDKLIKPSKLQPGIPAAFEAVVIRLLAKVAEDRYPTAAAVVAEVEPIAKEHEIKL